MVPDIAPPKGIPATTQLRASVICSGGTADSATEYALTTKGAIAKPLKKSATANHMMDCTKISGIERRARENKKSMNRPACSILHFTTPLMIAATALPNAQTANKMPDSDFWPLSWAKATVTMAIAPKNPPRRVLGSTTARITLFLITAGCGVLSRRGEDGGSVARCIANIGIPIAMKPIPAMIPADGAINVAHAVAMMGPAINTNSSLRASSEYAVLIKWRLLSSSEMEVLSGLKTCSQRRRTSPPTFSDVASAKMIATNHVQIGA